MHARAACFISVLKDNDIVDDMTVNAIRLQFAHITHVQQLPLQPVARRERRGGGGGRGAGARGGASAAGARTARDCS